jgi:predicted DNA-binding protein YlxM (UPF0122 family)
MRTVFLIFLSLIFVLPQNAFAGAPDCGAIDREDALDDVYRDARRLKYILLDIRDDIDILCEYMEAWHVWEEEDEEREDILDDDKEYQAAREVLIERALDDLKQLKHSIFLYRTWKEVEPTSKILEAKQVAYMNRSYTYITSFDEIAHSRGAEIKAMMHWNIDEKAP